MKSNVYTIMDPLIILSLTNSLMSIGWTVYFEIKNTVETSFPENGKWSPLFPFGIFDRPCPFAALKSSCLCSSSLKHRLFCQDLRPPSGRRRTHTLPFSLVAKKVPDQNPLILLRFIKMADRYNQADCLILENLMVSWHWHFIPLGLSVGWS